MERKYFTQASLEKQSFHSRKKKRKAHLENGEGIDSKNLCPSPTLAIATTNKPEKMNATPAEPPFPPLQESADTRHAM